MSKRQRQNHKNRVIEGAILGGLLGPVLIPGIGGILAGSLFGALLMSNGQDDAKTQF